MLQQPDFPADLLALFPQDVRDNRGHLTAVPAVALAVHLDRLATVRARLLTVFLAMQKDRAATSRTSIAVEPYQSLERRLDANQRRRAAHQTESSPGSRRPATSSRTCCILRPVGNQ